MAERAAIESLESQSYYHGFRSRSDAENVLKEVGDFLVRATDTRNYCEVVISIKEKTDITRHLSLSFVSGKWQFAILKPTSHKLKQFDSISELVTYYMKNPSAMPGRLQLKRYIPKPEWQISSERVIFDKKKDGVGSGNFCSVFKGRYRQTGADTDTIVAIKVAHETDSKIQEARQMIVDEAKAMAMLANDNVVKFYGVACDVPPVMIVMEFCSGGDLERHLRKQGNHITEYERVLYTVEICRGLRYLHAKKIIHCDLAARNVLISDDGILKISDFGLSKALNKDMESVNIEDPKGGFPMRWMAPEVLKKPIKFSFQSDLWSYGVVIYEIFNNGEKPFPDEEPRVIQKAIRAVKMPEMPKRTPKDIVDVVKSIWVKDPAERPPMATIYKKVHAVLRKTTPKTEVKDFLVNQIPGVKRTRVDKEVEENDHDHTRESSEDKDRTPSLESK